MWRTLLTCCFVSIAFSAAGQGGGKGPVFAEELREMTLGAGLSVQPKLAFSHYAADGSAYFSRPGDRLSYHGIPLQKILYRFEGGKLRSIELWTQRLGPGDKVRPDETDFLDIIERTFAECSPTITNLDKEVPPTTLGKGKAQEKWERDRVSRLKSLCDDKHADICRSHECVTEVAKDKPDARQLVARLTTVIWLEGETVSTGLARFQLVVEVIEGLSRAEIDEGRRSYKSMIDWLKTPTKDKQDQKK